MRGLLVVFSGLDGAGKSTQIAQLRRRLEHEGDRPSVIWTRGEYTPLAGRGLQEGRGRPAGVAGPGYHPSAAGQGRGGPLPRSLRAGLRLRWVGDGVGERPEGGLARADCVVIATDHSNYDWAAIRGRATLVVDTRQAT